jgi:hypothetical protein
MRYWKYILIGLTFTLLNSCTFIWNEIIFYNSCDCKITTQEYLYNDSTYTYEWTDVVLWSNYAMRAERADEIREECNQLAEEYRFQYPNAYCDCD